MASKIDEDGDSSLGSAAYFATSLGKSFQLFLTVLFCWALQMNDILVFILTEGWVGENLIQINSIHIHAFWKFVDELIVRDGDNERKKATRIICRNLFFSIIFLIKNWIERRRVDRRKGGDH